MLGGLIDAGLGPAIGLHSDLLWRGAIHRVVILGPDELRRQVAHLHETPHRAFVGFAASKLGNRHDAKDVVNEAFAASCGRTRISTYPRHSSATSARSWQ